MTGSLPAATAPAVPVRPSTRRPACTLLLVSWLSAAIFSPYIVIFYGRAALLGTMVRDWNEVLPRLYAQAATTANLMIGMRFVTGAPVEWPRLPGLRRACRPWRAGLILRDPRRGPVMTLLAVVTWLCASASWLPHVRDQLARLA
jgi:hypothetical protein